MKKITLCFTILLLLFSCSNEAVVEIKDSYFERVEHNYEDLNASYRYVTEVGEEHILVVSENVTDKDNKMLNATRLNIEIKKQIEENIKVGTKVICITNGPSLTTYPLGGGLEIIELVEEDTYNSINSKIDVLSEAISTLKDVKYTGKSGLICVNDVLLKNEVWEIKLVVDTSIEEKLQNYIVYIDDNTLEVLKIEYYKNDKE